MRVLLDTTYLYRLMEAVGTLSAADRAFLGVRATEVYVSAVSLWEMRLKYAAIRPSGERKSRFAARKVLAMLENQDVVFLPLTMTHAAAALDHPLDHPDPFDDVLLAQAQAEGLRLLTVDRELVTHPLAVTP